MKLISIEAVSEYPHGESRRCQEALSNTGGVAVGAADQVEPAQDHERMAASFLRSLFRGQEEGFVALFQKPSKHSTFLPLNRKG